MPIFTVPTPDGRGSITVDANSYADALQNVGQAPTGGGGGGGGGPNIGSGAAGNPQVPTFQTVNGPRTPQQMADELRAAGWNGSGDLVTVYAQTTGGAVTPTGQIGGGTGQIGATPAGGYQSTASANSGGGGGGQGFNQGAAQLAAQLANNAALMAYNQAKLNLETEEFAFRKAQQAWQNTFQQAQFSQSQAAQEQQTAMSVLNLQAGLRGPQNAFQYARTLANTPQGLRDIVAAAAGRYGMARYGGSAPQGQSGPATVQGLLADVAGGTEAAAIPQYGALPQAGQLNAENMRAMNPTQRALLTGLYEYEGQDPADVEHAFRQSLPVYGGARRGVVAF